MPQRNHLLIVEPVAIVWAKADVENPLLEAKIALGEVVRQRFSFE
jgi:hypothetical protein